MFKDYYAFRRRGIAGMRWETTGLIEADELQEQLSMI